MKTVTVKDIFYALEYAGATLTRHPTGYKSKAYWTLDGAKVQPAIADEALRSGHVALIHETREGLATYGWRRQAA